MVKTLEPRRLESGQTILKEEESSEEIIFLMVGKVNVGYNQKHFLDENKVNMTSRLQVMGQKNAKFNYPINVKPGVPIGIFEIIFGQTSHFIYKTGDYSEVHDKQMYSSDIPRTDCFFIRRKAWAEMIEETDGIPKSLKKNILRIYMEKVYLPIQRYQ